MKMDMHMNTMMLTWNIWNQYSTQRNGGMMTNVMWVTPHTYVCNLSNSLHKDYRTRRMTYSNLKKEYKRSDKYGSN